MNGIYVLIVTWHVGTGGTAIGTQEFSSQKNCEAAIITIQDGLEKARVDQLTVAVCMPK